MQLLVSAANPQEPSEPVRRDHGKPLLMQAEQLQTGLSENNDSDGMSSQTSRGLAKDSARTRTRTTTTTTTKASARSPERTRTEDAGTNRCRPEERLGEREQQQSEQLSAAHRLGEGRSREMLPTLQQVVRQQQQQRAAKVNAGSDPGSSQALSNELAAQEMEQQRGRPSALANRQPQQQQPQQQPQAQAHRLEQQPQKSQDTKTGTKTGTASEQQGLGRARGQQEQHVGPLSSPVARPRREPPGALHIETSAEKLQVRTSVRDMVAAMDQASEPTPSSPPLPSSAQSTPSASILSDSTTLVAEAAMNSRELIPRLIERLDRKLIVMKEEQLSLMREMEVNEATGQRLFESLKRHLSAAELDKIELHAHEIEKVTKLILSLKLRLKRVEAELKERANQERARSPIQPRPSSAAAPSPSPSPRPPVAPPLEPRPAGARGLSDPTSTVGLPGRRQHQHHNSLQTQEPPQSSSSDSIFNSADSAIGSTITGHGGSAQCMEPAPDSPPQSHLSSSASVSSASSAGSLGSAGSSPRPASGPAPSQPPSQLLLTNTDILVAKRNKLVAQLDEAHQLEECIVRRNNVIIERILKKYYHEGSAGPTSGTASDCEIAEFRQFTRLKSLLLKDTHDVADRIDSAESQLCQLKQNSQCKL